MLESKQNLFKTKVKRSLSKLNDRLHRKGDLTSSSLNDLTKLNGSTYFDNKKQQQKLIQSSSSNDLTNRIDKNNQLDKNKSR